MGWLKRTTPTAASRHPPSPLLLSTLDHDEPIGTTPAPFATFFRSEYRNLVAQAYALAGSTANPEPIAQAAMLAVQRRWHRIDAAESAEDLARETCVRMAASPLRRGWIHAHAQWRGRSTPGLLVEVSPDCEEFWADVRSLPNARARTAALQCFAGRRPPGTNATTTATGEELTGVVDRGHRFAEELRRAVDQVDVAAALEQIEVSRRRSRLAARAVVTVALIGLVAAVSPRLSSEPEPVAAQPVRAQDLGISLAVPDGWVHGRQFFTGTELQMTPQQALTLDARGRPQARIYAYEVKYVWDADAARLRAVSPDDYGAWLRESPDFVVESEVPVRVAEQDTITLAFRAEQASGGTGGMIFTGLGKADTWEGDDLKYWQAGDVGLVTPLQVHGRTVVIEALVSSARDRLAISPDMIEQSYSTVLQSVRPAAADEAGPAAQPADFGISLPEIGDWRRDASGDSWTDLSGPAGGPFPTIKLTPVSGVRLPDGSCCGVPAGGLLPWLERESGLQVLSATTAQVQGKELVVFEVTYEPLGNIADLPVWATGNRPIADPVSAAPALPGSPPNFLVEGGARTLITLFVHDSQWLAFVSRLPDDASMAEQVRRDYLTMVDNPILERTLWWAGSRG